MAASEPSAGHQPSEALPDEIISLDQSHPIFGDPNSQRPHILSWGGEGPFNGFNGFEKVPPRRLFDTILSTHADRSWWKRLVGFRGPPSETFGITPDARAGIEFGLDHGMGSMLGRSPPIHLNDPIQERWYDQLDDDEKWHWPDGTTVDSLDEVAIRRIDGSPVHYASDPKRPVPSKHVPGVVDLFVQTAIDSISLGTDGHWIDGGTNFLVRDYSAWAIAAFRDHLAKLDQARLEELGVEDPGSLDVTAEIRNRTPLESGEHPAQDPLYREYIKQDYRMLRTFMQQVRDGMARAHDTDSEDLVLFTNQLAFLSAPELLAITAEPLSFPCGESQHSVPPNEIYDFNIKLGVAAGRFEKSAFNMGTHVTRKGPTQTLSESDMDVSTVQTDLLSVDFAEQIANRGIGAVNVVGDQFAAVGDAERATIHTQPSNWFRADGTMPDQLQELTGFAWSSKELFRGGAFQHDVAVVLSIPTLMWARAQPWGKSNNEIMDAFSGAASLVRGTQRPYDVLYFGHPDLWDDSGMMDRLSTYEQVVLPSVRSISDAQRKRLNGLLDDGLHLITTGDRPSRDADYEPLSEAERRELLDHANTTVLDGHPAREFWNEEGHGEPLIAALSENAGQVTTDTDSPIGPTIQTQTDPDRVILQVINYDFDLDNGQINPLSNVRLQLRDGFVIELSTAKLYRPHEAPTEIEVGQDGNRVEVTLPSISVWATIALGPTEEAVSLQGDSTVAEQAIQSADNAIRSADDEGRSDGLEHAKRFRDRANTAFRYTAYQKAEIEAEKAQHWAEQATRTPVVGIDTGHNQPEASGGSIYDDFDGFRSSFIRDIEFTKITEWTSDTLSELDVLIVPPALASPEVPPFEFTEEEAELLGDFTERGGGVMFLARSGIAQDHSVVLDQYGIEFESGTVHWPEGSDMEITRMDTHRINQTILNITDAGPGAVPNVPGTSKELLQYPEDTGGWLDVCGDQNRQDCDKAIAGRPFATLTPVGAGTVMTYGRFSHVRKPSWASDREFPFLDGVNLLRNTISYLAQNSLHTSVEPTPHSTVHTTNGRKPKEESTTPRKSTGSPPPTHVDEKSNTTVAETPGFGFAITTAAYFVIGAIAKWLVGTDNT